MAQRGIPLPKDTVATIYRLADAGLRPEAIAAETQVAASTVRRRLWERTTTAPTVELRSCLHCWRSFPAIPGTHRDYCQPSCAEAASRRVERPIPVPTSSRPRAVIPHVAAITHCRKPGCGCLLKPWADGLIGRACGTVYYLESAPTGMRARDDHALFDEAFHAS